MKEQMNEKTDPAVDHAARARELFLSGYNCAQAVVCAFSDRTGLDQDFAARMACSFDEA